MTRVLKILSAACLTALICLQAAAGSQLTVDRVLENMENTSTRLVDLQADFLQTKVMALFDESIVSKGKFYFRNPDKLILDTVSPEHQQLIINHNKVWLHYPEMKQVHKLSLQQTKGLNALFVGFGGSVRDIRSQFEVEITGVEKDPQGGTVYTLSLKPIEGTPAASPALGLKKVLLSVPEGRWYPVRSEIVQSNGDRSIYEYSNHRLNLKLSEARFTFSPPAGTEVITHQSPKGVSE
ncbi:MAG: outer membrane lipoprotein carrier protein LolA [Candidatus Glassbacteria bacterium]|nr:outer membrane lipoprotein carrier protein LolA [Candidatus Glassbacteria bacterium]